MIIRYKDVNDGNAVKEYNGSLLRLTGADGGVVLMSASALTLTGTNGTVTAGQTLDLSTLLTVPSALAGKTVSWSKTDGSDKLTLSGADVTAASDATASDSATFTATVAGITATVTVTAAEAAPATYDITVPTVTGATITVLVNGASYTSGKLTHDDAVKITVAAQTNYNLTSSSVTMGGQPVTGSNGEYNISSVTGAVEISVTVEAAPSPTGVYISSSASVANYTFKATFEEELPTTDIEEIEIRYAYDSSTNPLNARFILLQNINGAWKAWYKRFNDGTVDNISAGQVDISQYNIAVHEASTNTYKFSSSVTDRTMYARTSMSNVDDVKAGWA